MILHINNLSRISSKLPYMINGIEGLAFNLLPGKCLAISGPSGSDKSIILNKLIGKEDRYRGERTYDETPISRLYKLEPAITIPVVFQDSNLSLNRLRKVKSIINDVSNVIGDSTIKDRML